MRRHIVINLIKPRIQIVITILLVASNRVIRATANPRPYALVAASMRNGGSEIRTSSLIGSSKTGEKMDEFNDNIDVIQQQVMCVSMRIEFVPYGSSRVSHVVKSCLVR